MKAETKILKVFSKYAIDTHVGHIMLKAIVKDIIKSFSESVTSADADHDSVKFTPPEHKTTYSRSLTKSEENQAIVNKTITNLESELIAVALKSWQENAKK